MIVVAAITRIKIPIANAILAAPNITADSTDSATSLCQTRHTFGKTRRRPAMCVNYAVARLDPSSCEWRLTKIIVLCDRPANADVHHVWRMNSVESGSHKAS
jgi:hypothetical protein